MRVRTLPLVVALAATSAGALGLALGVFLPSWGLAGGAALALLTFGAGLWTLPEHRELRAATLLLGAATLAFVLTSAPRTWVGLEDFGAEMLEAVQPAARRAAEDARSAAARKWAVMAFAAAGALIVAWSAPRRAERERSAARARRGGGAGAMPLPPTPWPDRRSPDRAPAAATLAAPAEAATETPLGDDPRGGGGA
jgi:hypothetical protein